MMGREEDSDPHNIEGVYLVNEQVAEDTRAGDDHVDARSLELFQGDEFQFVHSADGVRHGTDAAQGQDLEGRREGGRGLGYEEEGKQHPLTPASEPDPHPHPHPPSLPPSLPTCARDSP